MPLNALSSSGMHERIPVKPQSVLTGAFTLRELYDISLSLQATQEEILQTLRRQANPPPVPPYVPEREQPARSAVHGPTPSSPVEHLAPALEPGPIVPQE